MSLVITKLIVTIFTLIIFISTTGSFFKRKYEHNKYLVAISVLIAVVSTYTTVHFLVEMAKNEIVESLGNNKSTDQKKLDINVLNKNNKTEKLVLKKEEQRKKLIKKDKEKTVIKTPDKGIQSANTQKEIIQYNKYEKTEKIVNNFIDHGNGTVTDTITKLMWKKCSEGLSGNNCDKGKPKGYGWDDIVLNYSKGTSFAGYDNWRIPTIKELRTLVRCSNGTPQEEAWSSGCSKSKQKQSYKQPTIDNKAFPNSVSWRYWSSTEKRSTYARFVNFNHGNVDCCNNIFPYYSRLVRSD